MAATWRVDVGLALSLLAPERAVSVAWQVEGASSHSKVTKVRHLMVLLFPGICHQREQERSWWLRESFRRWGKRE